MNAELVGHQEQPFPQEIADPVRDDAVSLHLAEPQTARPAPAVSGLPSQSHHWSSRPRVHLVVDQVAQPLVVDGPNEDEIFQSLPRVGVEHELVAVFLVAEAVQLLGLALHVERPEGSGILRETTLDRCQFGDEAFDAVPDGHAGGNAVRVDDHIRNDALDGKG